MGAEGSPPEVRVHPTRVVVGFVGGIPGDVETRVQQAGGAIWGRSEHLRFVAVEAVSQSQADLIAAMLTYADVAYAVPDQVVSTAFVPNDTRYGSQWGPGRVGAEAAWDVSMGNASVMVAVVDSGVRCSHEDLVGVCEASSSAAADACNHGTTVAGIIAARTNNALGGAGLSQTQVYAVNASYVETPTGCDSTVAGVALAIEEAISASHRLPIRIITMSLATNCVVALPCEPLHSAVSHAHDEGLLLVAAAGNTNCDLVLWPAAYPQVMAIGALSAPPNDNQRRFDSACGEELDLLAPGEDVFMLCARALPGGAQSDTAYCSMSQTSVAAPHVSGSAALVWSVCPGLSRDVLRGILNNTAVSLGDAVPRREQGNGVVRVDRALNEALGRGDCLP